MLFDFYLSKFSTEIVPTIFEVDDYDSNTLTFTGKYPVSESSLPQTYIVIFQDKQYPLLIKITKKEIIGEIEAQKLRLYYEIIKEIVIEAEFIEYLPPSLARRITF